MRASVCVMLLCVGLLLAPVTAWAQKSEKDQEIRQAEEKARQTERQLDIGRTVGRLLLDVAQRDARAKQRSEDEEKLKLAQNIMELFFGVTKQVNQMSLDARVKELNAQHEADTKARSVRQAQEAEQRDREFAEYREMFDGVVDIYLEPAELQNGRPALTRVKFEGIASLAGRKVLRFRGTQQEETWSLDPGRILAVRSSLAPPAQRSKR